MAKTYPPSLSFCIMQSAPTGQQSLKPPYTMKLKQAKTHPTNKAIARARTLQKIARASSIVSTCARTGADEDGGDVKALLKETEKG